MANEDNDRGRAFQMPDELTVVAIGGAGKKLVSRLADHEWFLKHYLLEGKRLRIYTMDTDSNQRQEDIARMQEVNSGVSDILKSAEGMGGSVRMQYHYLPDLANVERVSSLTGRQVLEQVKSRKAEPLVKVWWMNDPDEGFEYADLKKIDRNITDDFGGGVHRRRAISKAIFYKAITQGGDTFPSFQGHGPIAIVVGLGGGTGSGMFIDLARYIKGLRGEETKIWLFAVLPAVGEGEKEQLNAAVALTEMEYLNLKEEKLFNYIILSSLSPTGYVDGGDRIKEVREFDQAFPYMLINSLYLPTADISAIADAKKEYSGFIFSDSHIIEYPVEELIGLKTEFENVIRELGNFSADRRKYLDEVKEFLDGVEAAFPSQLGAPDEIEITRDDINVIKRELKRLEKTWTNDIARDLNYNTSAEIISYINNNFLEDQRDIDNIDTYDRLLDYISKLVKYLQGGGKSESKKLENESDKNLYTHLTDALAHLQELVLIQKTALRVKEQAARLTLLKIARGETDFGPVMGELTARLSALNNEMLETNQKLQRKREEIDGQKKELGSVEARVKSECNSLIEPVNTYVAKKTDITTIGSLERKFLEAFQKIIFQGKDEISRTKSKKPKMYKRQEWLSKMAIADVQELVDSLATKSGEDLGYLKDLTESVVLYDYYSYLLEISSKMGFIDKMLGRDLDREMLRSERNAKEDRIRRIAEMRYDKISIHDPFEVVVSEHFVSKDMDAQLRTRERDIITSLMAEFNLEYGDQERMFAAFAVGDTGNIIKNLKDVMMEVLEERDGYSEKVGRTESEIDAIIQSQKDRQQKIDFIRRTDKLADETFEARKAFSAHLLKFEESYISIDERRKRGNLTVEGLYHTRFGEINPNVLSLISDGAQMDVLDRDGEGKKEIEKLFKIVNWKYKDLIDVRKLGVTNFSISYGPGGTERWNFEKAALVVSSTSKWLSDLVSNSNDNFRRHIMSGLDLDSNTNAKITAHNYTKPWEVSLTFYAAASFLDNISPMTTGGGYWEKYEKKSENLLHHALFLQDGKYIIRKKTLLLKEAAAIANKENGTEAEIQEAREEILALYNIKDIREALKPDGE